MRAYTNHASYPIDKTKHMVSSKRAIRSNEKKLEFREKLYKHEIIL